MYIEHEHSWLHEVKQRKNIKQFYSVFLQVSTEQPF